MTLSLSFGPVVGIHTADISAQATSVVRLKVTCGAVMSNQTLTMSGNTVTDSYNSNNGPYDPVTPGSNGRVCTNGDVDLSGASPRTSRDTLWQALPPGWASRAKRDSRNIRSAYQYLRYRLRPQGQVHIS